MKYWLMFVICLPGHQTCEVKFGDAIYLKAQWCEQAADAALYFKVHANLQGVFCEMAARQPKTYVIKKGQLP